MLRCNVLLYLQPQALAKPTSAAKRPTCKGVLVADPRRVSRDPVCLVSSPGCAACLTRARRTMYPSSTLRACGQIRPYVEHDFAFGAADMIKRRTDVLNQPGFSRTLDHARKYVESQLVIRQWLPPCKRVDCGCHGRPTEPRPPCTAQLAQASRGSNSAGPRSVPRRAACTEVCKH